MVFERLTAWSPAFTLSSECPSLLFRGFCSYSPVMATPQGTPIVNRALMSEDRFYKWERRSRVIHIMFS